MEGDNSQGGWRVASTSLHFFFLNLEEVEMEGEWVVMLSMGENNTTRGEEATW
jgi:hypothetical protein